MKKKIKNLIIAPEKFLLYLNFFLLPLVFCPWFQNILDFPKRKLFLLLSILTLLVWLGRSIFKKDFKLKTSPLFFVFLLLVLVLIISSSFSICKTLSFLGSASSPTDNLLTFIILVLNAFLVYQIFSKKEILNLIKVFVISSALSVFFGILQIFNIYILPSVVTKNASFNLLGRVSLSGLLSAILLPITLVILFLEKKKSHKLIFGVIAILFLFALVLYDLKLSWIELFIFSIILSVFSTETLSSKKEIIWTLTLSFLLILSIFFFFLPVNLSFFPSIPNEVSPGFGTEIDILKGVYHEGIKNIILGVGPGNFVYGYNKYHSPVINQTIFWNTRFTSGDSTFFDWFITKGIIGGATLLLLYLAIIWRIIKVIKEEKEKTKIVVAISGALVVLIIGTFFYSYNFFLWVVFWLFLAALMAFDKQKTKTINLSSALGQGIAVTSYIIIIALSVICVFGQVRLCLADANYLKGTAAGKVDKAINYFQKATTLYSADDLYWRSLAQTYLLKANDVSQDKDISQQDRVALVNKYIQEGISAFNRALQINSYNPANWNSRGYFYRNLIGINGAGELALSSYRKAIELEPASPFAYTEMARTYILIAQDFARQNKTDSQKEALKLASIQLNKAIGLKQNYAPAHYLLAVVFDQQGETTKAIEKLEETKKYAPQDTGVLFQTGMLYWRTQQLDKAKENFEEAIKIKPDYSNALYMLGLVYDKEGKKEKALSIFEKVLKLNPENQEVLKIIDNLKNNRPALEGIIVQQKTLQEEGLEIDKSGQELNP